MSFFQAKKAGLALQTQKKLEEKYDVEDAKGTPTRVGSWLSKILAGEHMECTRYTWRNLAFWLRDGVVLCKLINKLRAHSGMSTIKIGGQNNLTPFIALQNISEFSKAAVEYGLPTSAVFPSEYLYECKKGLFLSVINCLDILGTLANEKGFQPSYETVDVADN